MTSPRQAPKAAEIYLDEMIQAIDLIIRYTERQNLDQFQAVGNEEKQDAVVRRFEILGEAAYRDSPDGSCGKTGSCA